MFLEQINVHNVNNDKLIKLEVVLKINNNKALIYGFSENIRLLPIIQMISNKRMSNFPREIKGKEEVVEYEVNTVW